MWIKCSVEEKVILYFLRIKKKYFEITEVNLLDTKHFFLNTKLSRTTFHFIHTIGLDVLKYIYSSFTMSIFRKNVKI